MTGPDLCESPVTWSDMVGYAWGPGSCLSPLGYAVTGPDLCDSPVTWSYVLGPGSWLHVGGVARRVFCIYARVLLLICMSVVLLSCAHGVSPPDAGPDSSREPPS